MPYDTRAVWDTFFEPPNVAVLTVYQAGEQAVAERHPRILVADDQHEVCESLEILLGRHGYTVVAVSSPQELLARLRSKEFDTVLMDLNYERDTTSGKEGLTLIHQIREMDETLPIVVMTAWGSVDGAVEAMRSGARDYIEKPWDNTRLLTTLAQCVELTRAVRTSHRLAGEAQLARPEGLPLMIADAPAMRGIMTLMRRVGPSDARVLITGEHGTGKEIVARWLHASSPRAAGPFVAVNIGALAESVRESEVFGHVRGAFTDAKADRIGRFELAHGGTLFLDEIATTPLGLQATLLRAIESGEFQRVGCSQTRTADVRVISATNADLRAEVQHHRFREDLFFRLNTVEIHLPPLRSRQEDIPRLASHFLHRHLAHYDGRALRIGTSAMNALVTHTWPGNIRELDHAIERAVLVAEHEEIRPDDLGLQSGPTRTVAYETMTMAELEQHFAQAALDRHGGNVSAAARALGLSRGALYRRLGHQG